MLSRLGKIPTTSVRRRISRFRRSVGLFDQICFQISFGNTVNARISSLADSRCANERGSLCSSASRTRSNWACTDSLSGWSNTVCSSVFTHGHELFGVADIRFAA